MEGESRNDRGMATPHVIPPRVAFAAVVAVAMAIFGSLGWVLYSAHASFVLGLRLVEKAANNGYNPTSVAWRIFLLASGEQMASFRVIGFAVAALLALVGGIFILNGAEVTYRAGLSAAGARGALE